MFYYRLEVTQKNEVQTEFNRIEKTVWEQTDQHFKVLSKRKVYLIESNRAIHYATLEEIFYDPILENLIHAESKDPTANDVILAEVRNRSGVTDNAALVAKEALDLFDIKATVSSAMLYIIANNHHIDIILPLVEKYFSNPLIQSVTVFKTPHERFAHNHPEKVKLPSHQSCFETIPLNKAKLESLNQQRALALSEIEIEQIITHYQNNILTQHRSDLNLPVEITDVELEVIAQTWSEHCKHKIFNAEINYEENISSNIFQSLGNFTLNSLYKDYVKSTTETIKENGCDWTVSVFSDNAGIVNFDENIYCCIKVETHNSPSALDPYGGAITGILGVNRDILGCGMGAKPIANTNVLCFADPNWPSIDETDLLPIGPMTPAETLRGVHKGIEAGGNKSGIPTVNGAFYFDRDFAGKPLVFCGTVGILPKKLLDGTDTAFKKIKVGDRIVMAGGAIGVDGIHGATFSSMALDDTPPATAVQIGDPLTQKRLTDFLLAARDQQLYSGLTDNGAGGLSSSVGELALETNGARIDLAICPTKYPGLLPYELLISESQERMTFAVPPEKCEAFLKLAAQYGVLATNLGEFTDDLHFTVYHEKQCVAHLNLDFLHHQLPKMKLTAQWDGAKTRSDWGIHATPFETKKTFENKNLIDGLKSLLARKNIASKEKWIRRYDHEVGAATQLKPLQGLDTVSPNNAGVIHLQPHGGHAENAVAIGCGLFPRLSLYDPYLMAQFSVDEAIRNIIAVGAAPDKICLLDNFCWPDPIKSTNNPDGDKQLGALVRSCAGLKDAAIHYGTPLVSGKDSMKNNFRGFNKKKVPIHIAVLPTLLITSMGAVNSKNVIDSAFKATGDMVFMIGGNNLSLAYSEFSEIFEIDTTIPPEINLEINQKTYDTVYQLIQNNLLQSCHDISEGGALVAIAESCFSNQLGMNITLSETDPAFWFNENPGQFIISVKNQNAALVENILMKQSVPVQSIGVLDETQSLYLNQNSITIESLYQIWSQQFESI